MMKALRGLFAFFCLGALALLALPSALAQKSLPPPADTLSSAVPKDIHTRAKLHTELGSLYFQNGNLIVALEELTIAISINPNYAQAYSTRGLVLYYIKELESAEKDFQRALNLDEKDPEINNNYGWFLCHIGKEKESIAYFLRAIKSPLYQTPETAYLNAGTCYSRIGELALAEEFIRKNLRFSPDNPQALFQLANISYKRGNYDAAKEHLKNVVRLSDPDAEVLWLLLRVERRLGDRSAESSQAAQLRRKFPDSPEYQEFLKGNFE
ncbi:type IV pilus biogenesis/stability protein PilW [Propionivibrio sp.]|uniref:type IV pilus biogenesis/stability protein PilW n=1 Tax=Propionivibrio sp. TaxID=2212460 RepID=UPI003BF22F44